MENTIYFDNAATTFPKPLEVSEFADSFYRQCGVNAGRGTYPLATKADNLITETRIQCLDLFHATGKKQTVFCSSATETINLVLQGLCYDGVKNVFISPFEHNAVLRTIYYLQSIYKFNIIELSVKQNPLQYDIARIKKQFDKTPPDMVLLTHASNVCGLIAPFDEIFSLAKKSGAVTLLDMSQSAGLVDTDLSGEMVDYAVFAGHKTLYAPFGIAGLIMKRKPGIRPLLYGGTGINSVSKKMPDSLPERFEAGSHNIYAIAGLSAALKWIKRIGISEIRNKEIALTNALKALLRGYPNVHIVGDNNGVSIVSCVFDGYSPDEIGYVLACRGIAVRTGLHCSPLAHKFLRTAPNGAVRFSLSYFNTDEDLKQLKSVLNEIANDG